MNIDDAIDSAKQYLQRVYRSESINNIGLEEIAKAENGWHVTLGFTRPWNAPKTRAQEVMESIGGALNHRRSMKIITIDENGQVVSMRDRHVPNE